MITYRIDTMGGPIARWMPSLEAAKKRYIASTLEGWRDSPGSDPEPAITFERSTEDEDGTPRPEYTRCITNGRWDSSISVERTAWPTYDLSHGDSPELVMQRATGPHHCPHEHLVCNNSCPPLEGWPEPRIRCAACGTTWGPAPATRPASTSPG